MCVRSWKHQFARAMPCKIMKKNCGSDGSNKVKTKLSCIVEADEIYETAYGKLSTELS